MTGRLWNIILISFVFTLFFFGFILLSEKYILFGIPFMFCLIWFIRSITDKRLTEVELKRVFNGAQIFSLHILSIGLPLGIIGGLLFAGIVAGLLELGGIWLFGLSILGFTIIYALILIMGRPQMMFREVYGNDGNKFVNGRIIKNSEIEQAITFVNNSPWKGITERYWTKECDEKLRVLCEKFGLYAKELFSVFEFQEIVGNEKYWEWYYKLKEKQDNSMGNGPQGYMNGFIELKCYQITKTYPEIKNKCVLCGKDFNFKKLDGYTFRYITTGLKIDSLKDFCICKSCSTKFIYKYKTKITDKQKALKLLKEIYNIFGRIPSATDFNLSHIRELPIEKRKIFFKILLKIPYLKFYKKAFGSWFNALVKSGILNEGVRKLQRGVMCTAKDEHICLSLSEMDIDNWLTDNKIIHSKEPKYPRDDNFNPNGQLRADWKIGEYYVEFFGLQGNKDYDIKIELKKDLCKKLNLRLIEVYPNDLKRLETKLNILKTPFHLP